MSGRIIVIGASLSGIDALCELVSHLPADFGAPIFVTQHVASHSPGMLPQILSHAGALKACHPKNTQLIEPGNIYVAPPDRHMLIRKGYVALSHGPHENLARPAIDPTFRSAAVTYGPAVAGVILTGQLDDGTAGLLAIKDQGGIAIVQEPEEATAPSMPISALKHVKVDHRLRVREIAELLTSLAKDDPSSGEAEVQKLMQIEDRIAEGVFNTADWWAIESLSTASGFNCPDCTSALYELNDKRVLRFRCRSGHGFTAQSLLSGQSETREKVMSSLFGVLLEEATLAKRMQTNDIYKQDKALADSLGARAAVLEREAVQVCDWLHALTGLVEPEPSGRPAEQA